MSLHSNNRIKKWAHRFVRSIAHLTINPKSRQQLIEILHKFSRKNLIDNESLKMIEGVLHISEMQVRDIMIARAQMIVINPQHPFEEALSTILQSAHSRFPVIDDDQQVKGILLAKDLLRFSYTQTKKPPNLYDIMHKATFVPESKRLDKLLSQFRVNYNHMAIVVDEYNNVAGLVTIEDVLEQIVGNIEDEHYVEPSTPNITFQAKGEYRVEALTPLQEFNSYFSTHFDEKEFDTIGGLVAQRFGRLPKRGETITVEGVTFYVLNANKRKIEQMKITMPPSDSVKSA